VGVAADAVVDNVDYLDTSEGHLSPEMADDAAEEDDADLDIDPRNSKAATSTIVSSFAMTYSSLPQRRRLGTGLPPLPRRCCSQC